MNRNIKRNTLVSIAPFALSLSGCASMVNGANEQISFKSQPSGATVIVDDKKHGATPVEVELDRSYDHHAVIRLEGYKPEKVTLKSSIDASTVAWSLPANLVSGGVFIGIPFMIADASSGAYTTLDPKEVSVDLVPREDTVAQAVNDAPKNGLTPK